MKTMNRVPADLARLPGIPRDEEGPVFAEPWEAQAFALAVHLAELGHFSWADWSAALAEQIRAAAADGDPGLGDTYYRHWLDALETLCTAKGLVMPEGLLQRTEEWRVAYRRTPHGQPVQLTAARGREQAGSDRPDSWTCQ
jgi:nitrile hydratase accessory protein